MSGGNLDFPNGDTGPKQNIRSVVDVINFVNSGNTMNVVFQKTDKYILNWSGIDHIRTMNILETDILRRLMSWKKKYLESTRYTLYEQSWCNESLNGREQNNLEWQRRDWKAVEVLTKYCLNVQVDMQDIGGIYTT